MFILFFSKLFYPKLSIFVTPDFGQSDVLHFNYPLKEYLGESLKENQLPFWSNDVGGGMPIFSEGQIGTFYIFNLILFKFLANFLAYNLNYLISYFLAFAFSYLFCREIKLSKKGSFLSAVVFTFSGFISVRLHHFNLVQAVCLLPGIFYFSEKLIKKYSFKWVVFLAFLLSEQIFTGHSYMVFITCLGVVIYILGSLWERKKRKGRALKIVISFGSVFLLAFLLAAIQIIPTWELKAISQREKGLSFDMIVFFPYPLKHIATLIDPYLLGDPRIGTYPPYSKDWGIFWENTFYLGLIPLGLILLSLGLLKKGKVVVFWFLVIFSFLLVLGKNSPLYFIFYFYGFNFFRVTAKYLLLTTWGGAILAGLGMDFLLGKIKKGVIRNAFFILLLGFSFWQLFDFYDNYHLVGEVDKWLKEPKTARYLPDKSRVLAWEADKEWNKYFLSEGFKNKEVYNFLRNNLTSNLGLMYGFKNFRVNTGGLVPKRILFMNFLTLGSKTDFEKEKTYITNNLLKILSLYNVSYITSSYEIKNENLEKVYEVKPGKGIKDINSVKVYENKNVLDRVRIYKSDQVKVIKTVAELEKLFFEREFLEKNYLVLEKGIKCKGKENDFLGDAEIKEDRSTFIKIKVDVPECRFLVLADSFVPGWEAKVDGKKTKIYPAFLNQKVVVVPSGTHEVVFKYTVPGLKKGAVISGVTVFLLVLLGFASFLGKGFYKN